MGITVTTLNSSTLSVTLEEKCKLAGVDRSTKSISSYGKISDLYNRIVSVATGGTEIIKFDASKGAGTFDNSINYIRITNKDSTNYITLTFSNHITAGSGDELFALKLTAGKSIVLPGIDFGAATSDADGMIAADDTIALIKAQANSAAVDVEIVIGG